MNELLDFNLEIVMAAKEKLEELGAGIVLTRDRDEIDVPINDRMDKLIEVKRFSRISAFLCTRTQCRTRRT